MAELKRTYWYQVDTYYFEVPTAIGYLNGVVFVLSIYGNA